MKNKMLINCVMFLLLVFTNRLFSQTTYDIGPGQPYLNIVEVPWSTLVAGDVVNIHYRIEPYKEKFAITNKGTEIAPITVHGVLGPNGERPVIDGNGAVTRSGDGGYNQTRGIVNIGGFDNHADYVVVENLEIINAHTPYTYLNGSGSIVSYNVMSAGIFIEASYHVTVRNNIIHDCGNGFFVASNSSDGINTVSKDIMVENNYFYDNGNLNSITEHNSYCEAINITYQYNHYGPLLSGSRGYCLKDRSANTVIRYNWIEGGRQEISLDEAQDASPEISSAENYNVAYIYGNVLIKTDFAIGGWADDQMVGFGGDQGGEIPMRKGPLYIYNNTFVTQMNVKTKTGTGNFDRTCVLCLNGGGIPVDIRNNIFHKTGTAAFSILNDNNPETPSVVSLKNNWLTKGWVKSLEGNQNIAEVSDLSTVTGTDPDFENLASQDFHLVLGSVCINAGTTLEGDVSVTKEYVKHQTYSERLVNGKPDLGAYESDVVTCVYSISPLYVSATSGTLTGDISITAPEGCEWTAISNNSWLTIISGESGTGSGTVNYSISENTGVERMGTIVIADQSFSVTQAAATTNIESTIKVTDLITVFPNPAKSIVNIVLTEPVRKSTSIELINSFGVPVAAYVFEIGESNKTIDLNGFIPGLYFLRSNTELGIITLKFIIII